MALPLPSPTEQVLAFASGSNHPGEIRGFAAVGQPLGIAADECRGPCERAILSLAGGGIPVFADSGAFAEIEFGPKGPRVVKPITHEAWLERLGLYQRLADGLGADLYVVAPDMVGRQKETLERLRRYRDQVQSIRKTGARILVPFQGGRMSLPEFDRAVKKALGFDDYIVAFPMKKGATDPNAIAAFLGYRKPKEIHLLGLGAKNPQAPKIVEMIHDKSPHTRVSLDSNRLKAYVGWEYGEYVKRMERLGIKPMPKTEWVPKHHLILPGFRTVRGLSPRDFTLARQFVGPISPRFSLELGEIHQTDLGLKRWVQVWDDEEMVRRVDEWLGPQDLEEIVRQRQIGDAWENYDYAMTDYKLGRRQTKPKRPPELGWMPAHDEWPLASDWPEHCESLWDVSCKEVFDDFMRKPSTWVLGRFWHKSAQPKKLTPGEFSWMASNLRPFYLDYLGRKRLNGGTVASAWRKDRSVQATFGEGRLAKDFQRWKKRLRAITTQRDFEMQLAIRQALSPTLLSFADDEVVSRGERYPEYEELLLRYWDQLSPAIHWEREQRRAQNILFDKYKTGWVKRREKDPYYRWTRTLRDWKELPGEAGKPFPKGEWHWVVPEREVHELLRSVAQMRVAQRQGKRAALIPGVPNAAHAKLVKEYQPPPTYELRPGERVANKPARVLKRRLLR